MQHGERADKVMDASPSLNHLDQSEVQVRATPVSLTRLLRSMRAVL